MKFKKGDKVILKEYSVLCSEYPTITWNEDFYAKLKNIPVLVEEDGWGMLNVR